MLRKTLLGIAITFVLVSFAHSGQGPDIHEGEWKITVSFDMPGVPMEMPPVTYNQCITKENSIPKADKPNQSCETKQVTTKGNTVTWTAECTNRGGKMFGNGTVTYAKDKMTGTMTMTMEGQAIKMKSQYVGQRIGECK